MTFNYNNLVIRADNEVSLYAAELFSEEIKARTGKTPEISADAEKPFITFTIDEESDNKDVFVITENEYGLTITAKTIRGLIFGYFLFLRKTRYENGIVTLVENITGTHSPQKKIRGHQVGYRTTPNTYDAWNYEQYFRYYLDMMAFGTNTCEHNTTKFGKGEMNPLMRYTQEEFVIEASRLADKVDLDVSLWHANDDNETEEEALALREKIYSKIPRINAVFPPGGDPGEMYADDFIERCKKISHIVKSLHPEAEMHPSAQAPHKYKDWGDVLIRELRKEPDEIDTVIMGPNHAFPMHDMRKKVPAKYPIRFYPDITHNLRCEYPVNFLEDDWHYALCSTLSRESVNPRPTELRTLHRIFSPYTIGSVSYSEGVHDDVNKMIWSALEWNKDADLREILLDYARLFFYGTDEEKIADTILLLEKSWQGDPVENPCIDFAYNNLCELKANYPALSDNWRFMLLYFRGCCDKIVKMRRSFENKLCKDALRILGEYNIHKALTILKTPFNDDYNALRDELNKLAEKLFNLIGIQLDVEHYYADSWERGATLETIDNNVSDKAFLIEKLTYALTLPENETNAFLDRLVSRNKTEADEIYYSVALHGLNTLGFKQDGEVYMDIQGDRPYTKETPLPMSMTKVYDNFSLKAKFGGFNNGCDYILTVVYKSDKSEEIKTHRITANNHIIYEGEQFGGIKNEQFDKEMLVSGFESASYILKSDVFVNGTLELEICEPNDGFKFCELWIKKA